MTGAATLLIRRRRPAAQPSGAGAGAASIALRTEGTAGAGRIIASLSALGLAWAAVVQAVVEADAPPADLARIELGQRYERVILGSHLVNAPDPDRRAALLAFAARHLEGAGTLLVEHHPIDWAETAADVEPTPGAALGMVQVRRDPPFVSAVSVYDAGGRVVRQPFRARVLSEAELAEALSDHGLVVRERRSPTWIEAARRTI